MLGGKLSIDRLVLVGPDILIETKSDGTGNWVFDPPAPTREDSDGEPVAIPDSDGDGSGGGASSSFSLGVDTAVIRDGVFTYRDGITGAENIVVITEFEGHAPDIAAPVSLNFAGSIDGKPLSFDGTVGALTMATSAPFPIDLDLRAGGAQAKIEGKIANLAAGQGIDVDVAVSGDQLADLGAFTGSPLPSLGAYELNAHVGGGGDLIELTNLRAVLGDSDLAGSAGVALDGRRPQINVHLTSTRIDLRPFAGDGAAGSEVEGGADRAEGGSSGRYMLSDAPLPLGALQSVDAEVTLAIEQLQLDDDLAAENVDLTLSLAGGRLQIAPLTMNFFGGDVVARADIKGGDRGTPVAVKLDLTGIDFGALLANLADQQNFAGRFDFNADLNGGGSSLHAIAASLNGPIQLRAENGTIDNRWLKLVTGGVTDILGPLFGNADSAALHCAHLDAMARGGVINVANIAVDSEVFSVFGGGQVDMRDETMNLHFDTNTGQAAITSLVPPFSLVGPINDPGFRPDLVGAVGGIASILGGTLNPQAALDALSGGGTDSGLQGSARCEQAARAAAETPRTPTSAVTDTVEDAGEALEGALDTVTGGVRDAIESGDTDQIEDAVDDAVEGIRGLFGR